MKKHFDNGAGMPLCGAGRFLGVFVRPVTGNGLRVTCSACYTIALAAHSSVPRPTRRKAARIAGANVVRRLAAGYNATKTRG